jgi:hypothetical protein
LDGLRENLGCCRKASGTALHRMGFGKKKEAGSAQERYSQMMCIEAGRILVEMND